MILWLQIKVLTVLRSLAVQALKQVNTTNGGKRISTLTPACGSTVIQNSTPSREYMICYDSQEMPGYYMVTTVTLDRKVYTRDELVAKRVDLLNDPLYYQIIDYIEMNEPPHEHLEDQ